MELLAGGGVPESQPGDEPGANHDLWETATGSGMFRTGVCSLRVPALETSLGRPVVIEKCRLFPGQPSLEARVPKSVHALAFGARGLLFFLEACVAGKTQL